jgi:hypothetical protein
MTSLIADSDRVLLGAQRGWQEVAEIALAFVKRFA